MLLSARCHARQQHRQPAHLPRPVLPSLPTGLQRQPAAVHGSFLPYLLCRSVCWRERESLLGCAAPLLHSLPFSGPAARLKSSAPALPCAARQAPPPTLLWRQPTQLSSTWLLAWTLVSRARHCRAASLLLFLRAEQAVSNGAGAAVPDPGAPCARVLLAPRAARCCAQRAHTTAPPGPRPAAARRHEGI